jgi:hypothetical protein
MDKNNIYYIIYYKLLNKFVFYSKSDLGRSNQSPDKNPDDKIIELKYKEKCY